MSEIQVKEIINDEFQAIGITLTSRQAVGFTLYYRELMEWNARMNLTAITDAQKVVRLLFADSAALCSHISGSASCLDVGSGAGFPGLPVTLLREDVQMTLLDSQKKRVLFLNYMIEKLQLQNCHAIQGRAEDFAQTNNHREAYDVVLSRAVAPLPVLLEYVLPFARVGGFALCPKGPRATEEIAASGNALKQLNGRIIAQHPSPTPDRAFTVLQIEKTGPCPAQYPRKAGTPAKSPL